MNTKRGTSGENAGVLAFVAVSAGLVLLVLSGRSGHAQQSPGAPATRALPRTALPRVFARELTLSVTGGQRVEGSFAMENTEDTTVGDLRVKTMVLGPLPASAPGEITLDTAPVHDAQLRAETFSLSARETRRTPFSVSLPPLPAGAYRFRVQVQTSSGRELGWDTVPLTLDTTANVAYALLDPLGVEAESVDPLVPERKGSEWPTLEGVNVNPAQAVVLHAEATNSTPTPLSAIPKLRLQRLLTVDAAETIVRKPPVTLPARGKTRLTFPLAAPTVPGAYMLILTLENAEGERQSNLGEYRIVVRGPSASVVKAALDTVGFRAGESVQASFSVVGPADRETTVDGSVEVAVLSNGDIVGSARSPVRLTRSPAEGSVTIPLENDIRGALSLRIVVADSAGSTLDTYTAAFPNIRVPAAAEGEEPSAAHGWKGVSRGIVVAVLLVLLVLLGLALLWLRRRTPGPPRTPTQVMALILMLVGAGVFALSRTPARAAAFQIRYCYDATGSVCGDYDLWVNRPIDGQELPAGATVAYEARATWLACLNGYSGGILSVYALRDGGQIARVEPPPRTDREGPPPHAYYAEGGIGRNFVRFFSQDGTHADVHVPPEQFFGIRDLGPWHGLARHRVLYNPVRPGFRKDSLDFYGTFALTYQGTHSTFWTEFIGVRDYEHIGGNPNRPHVRNAAVIDNTTVVRVKRPPDLTVRNLNTQGILQTGQTITLRGRVENSGTGAAVTSDTVFRVDGTPIGALQPTGPLIIGGGIDQSVPWANATEGSHTLQVCADSADVVTESSETNNCGSIPFTVAPAPTPTPTPTPTPSSPPPPPPPPGIPLPGFQEVP